MTVTRHMVWGRAGMSNVWWCGGSGVGLRLREGGGEGGKRDEERKGKESC